MMYEYSMLCAVPNAMPKQIISCHYPIDYASVCRSVVYVVHVAAPLKPTKQLAK